jgi:two-component system, sensor histidine kinase and response regulator
MLDRLPVTATPALILVVDDEPRNIQVIASLLIKEGHEVIAATDGEQALEKLRSSKPDLILLDVMMPGMTGFEMRRILRDIPELCEIPVIFLSAATDKSFIIEGFETGAVDYITKPFHGPELLSRVALHVNLQRTRQRMNDLVQEKNRLLEIVAHDLKNPLSGIRFAAMILAEKSDHQKHIQDSLVENICQSTERAFEIVQTLLETRGLDEMKATIHLEEICLSEQAREALRRFEQHRKAKDIAVEINAGEGSLRVLGERRALLCCLENLISNAIKFSPSGSKIAIELTSEKTDGVFRIEDCGPGVRDDEVELLFQKFSRLSARPTAGEASTGLGLHIVRELLHAMDGTVTYAESRYGGACFMVKLPLAQR